jgi:hypothetical protein
LRQCLCIDIGLANPNLEVFALAISLKLRLPPFLSLLKEIIPHLKIGRLNVRSLTSKAVIVNELITDHELDVIGLTETAPKPE